MLPVIVAALALPITAGFVLAGPPAGLALRSDTRTLPAPADAHPRTCDARHRRGGSAWAGRRLESDPGGRGCASQLPGPGGRLRHRRRRGERGPGGSPAARPAGAVAHGCPRGIAGARALYLVVDAPELQ